MNFLNYLTLIASVASFGLGLLVITRGKRQPLFTSFFVFALIDALWSYTNFHFLVFQPSIMIFRSQYAFGGALLISAIIWTLYFTEPQKKSTKVKIISSLGLIFFIIPFINGYIIESVKPLGNGQYDFQTGLLFDYYSGILIALLVYLLYKLGSAFIHARGIKRMQLRYVLLGISIFSIITFAFGVILPLFDIKPVVAFDAQSSLIWVALTAYSIVAHQLFDIRVIIKKTVVYSGLLLFTLAIYSTIIFIFTSVFGGQDALNPTLLFENILAATLIAIGFEPIRRYLTNVTDKYLFKGDYDPQSVLAQLSQKLSGSLDIKEATQSLVTLVKTEMRLSHAAVVTFGEEESKIIVKQATQDGYLNPGILLLPPENLFLQHFAHSPETIVTDILKSMCEGGENSNPNLQLCHILLVDLEKLNIAVAIPIKVNDKAVGMFLVGEKLSGDAYTKNEIEFLQIVANQTANAIQKARFWEEDQLKSEFVSIASHELLTPTAAMKGYLSMILDDGMGEIDETARKYLTKVFQSSERLAHLVEDLLNVSRIESGRLKINKKEFSLVESVQKATEELSVNAKNKSLDLAFVAAPQALANVYADPDHIYRVLINLIGNSIKYTSQGWVRCFVTQQDTQHLLFTVCDSGLGIPQENLPHLFEKFYRADRKEIAGIQGTGLGLYISKKIIDLMGGQMWVESQVGKGTTFYFTLPIAGTETAKQSEANTPHEVSALNTTGSTSVQQSAPAASAVAPSPTLPAKTN